MCRRIYIDKSFDELAEIFSFAQRGKVDDLGGRLPRYNGATAEVYHIIIQDVERDFVRPKPAFAIARWGLIPSWMERPRHQLPALAPREDIASNELFQDAYRSRRCLVPVSGFFEWQDGIYKKQPYAVAMKDRSMFALAGIWEEWRHPAGIEIRSFAVVTCQSNEMISAVHNRMPVVLRPDDYERWLSPDPDPRGMMKPFDAKAMTMLRARTRAEIFTSSTHWQLQSRDRWTDKLGEMVAALNVFNQNGTRMHHLNAQERALQDMSADLSSNISTIVAAAVARDLSRRIQTWVRFGVSKAQRVIAAFANGDLTVEMRGLIQRAQRKFARRSTRSTPARATTCPSGPNSRRLRWKKPPQVSRRSHRYE